MIGICTDSSSQLPAELAQRYGIEVVPLTVVLDDHEYLEGVDLDVDDFYDLYATGRCPNVQFNQPDPGQFAVAYDDLVARGCTQILSIHTSSAVSGTLNAARLATHSAPVPVRLVDSGTSRFGVSCCVWATAEAIREGASLDEAASVAEFLAPLIGTVFIVAGFELTKPELAGHGRSEDRPRDVLNVVDHEVRVLRQVADLADAVNVMAGYTLAWHSASGSCDLNVGIGSAHRAMGPIACAIAERVRGCPQVHEVVQFRIGPSGGLELGPGAVSCVMYPA